MLLVLHSIRQQIWKIQQWPQDWKRSVFIPIPKKGDAKQCSNYCTIAFVSRASKVMLKILQARLQQYVNWELPNVQPGFRKCRRIKYKIDNICRINKKAREFQKNMPFCVLTMLKPLCGSPETVENSSRDGNTRPSYLPPDKLYAGQEATVRTGHGTTDWFQIRKGVRQGRIWSLCLFNL